jgi:hypothetical protein
MSRMTRLPGVPDTDDIRPGMASYYGSGPWGKTCGDCAHRGYFKKGKDKINKKTHLFEDRRVKHNGCHEYLRLTHKHGPKVSEDWAACKYFQEDDR